MTTRGHRSIAAFDLPPLPYAEWEPTKTTLHLWCQIVGKIRLGCTAHRNHWWNVTLRPTATGLSAPGMEADGVYFDIDFDFVNHNLIVRSQRAHEPALIPLHDGLSVAEFYRRIVEALRAFGIDVTILAKPYGVPMTTPFPQDEEHRTYDRVMARRWWEIVVWTSGVLERFASDFAGKQSPVQLFWHSFDLAMARFSGRRAPDRAGVNVVERDAYSHEVIAFGFWAGDANIPAPTYYTYTAPEPADLAEQPLRPAEAAWSSSGAGHLGTLSYDVVRSSADAAATLLSFFQSGYDAGSRTQHWDRETLASATTY